MLGKNLKHNLYIKHSDDGLLNEDGSIYYISNSNKLYIDNGDKNDQINTPADWNEKDENTASYIKNRPDVGTVAECDLIDVIDDSDDVPSSQAVNAAIQALREEINIRFTPKGKKYGVIGIGQEISQLTRTYDSIGMKAEVGTDGDNSEVVNDFDEAYPFMRKKCVGNWIMENGHPKFNVQAYLGDADYIEDGSKGDYVAVECPLCYYYFDKNTGTLVISGYKYDGFRPFDIFCRNHNENDLIEKYYAPAYRLVVKDDNAVSLPGYDNYQGIYKDSLDTVRTYGNGVLGNNAILMPFTYNFYEWALFTVEFATQDCQSVMYGCTTFRGNNTGTCKFKDSTHIIVNKYSPFREVENEYITISKQGYTYLQFQATHKVLSIEPCDESGDLNSSGNYYLFEVQDLGKGYYTYDTLTSYYYAARPFRTGDCNSVSTPSGSPVSNTDGRHPCKYRWHENPYGSQYHQIMDLFNVRIGTGDDDYYLKWYYMLNPSEFVPNNNESPKLTDFETSNFEELDVITSHENYVDGYNKSKLYSQKYPEIWIPYENIDATAQTYTCDFCYLVNPVTVRAVRLGGFWANGLFAGFSFSFSHNKPGMATATFGADLFVAQ